MSAAEIHDTIARISWREFRVPFRAEFRAAHGTMTAREGFVVEVATASGALGLGEASPLPSFAGGTLAETGDALASLARFALGRTPIDAWQAPASVTGVAPGSLAAARCGLETAIAGLAARQSGSNLASWLASTAGCPSYPATVDIPVNAVLDMDTPAGVSHAVVRAIADGFQAVKLKVGGDPAADADRVAAAREAGGPGLELRVDANSAWSGDDARRFLASIATLNVALCEEPLAVTPDHFARLADLRTATAVPIGIDESCSSSGLLQCAIAAGAADAVVVKPMVTGLSEALAMLRLAGQHSLKVIVTTTFDTGIGTALAAHVAALIQGDLPACGLATLDHLEHSLVAHAPLVHRGAMRLPDGSGLGVSLDRAAFERYAIGPSEEVSR